MVNYTQYFVDKLFEKEDQRLNKIPLDLIVKNAQLLGRPSDGFWFKGELYTNLIPSLKFQGTKDNLDQSLQQKMLVYLDQKKQADFEKTRCIQCISLACFRAIDWQDVRDSVHEGLIDLHPATKPLKRKRPEAYALVPDTQEHRQYYKMRPSLEVAIAQRLLS